MRHRADHLPRRIARQLGVGVERDDILDLAQRADVARDSLEGAGIAAAQQCIEVVELAALAFPTHPEAVGFVPAARPVQQEEPAAMLRVIAPIQCIDQRGGGVQQLCLAVVALLR